MLAQSLGQSPPSEQSGGALKRRVPRSERNLLTAVGLVEGRRIDINRQNISPVVNHNACCNSACVRREHQGPCIQGLRRTHVPLQSRQPSDVQAARAPRITLRRVVICVRSGQIIISVTGLVHLRVGRLVHEWRWNLASH